MKKITAAIITIGDEILIGQITDTNSQWIANSLTKSGITVNCMLSISDTKTAIISTLKNLQDIDLLIFTGGLGPTNDDITKYTLADYYSSDLIVHEETLLRLKSYYESRGRELNELNKTQSLIPDKCKLLENLHGTAPGMWFNENNQIVISLPGVPLEMKKLMELQVLPKIKSHFDTPYIYHKTIHTIGIPESDLAIKLKSWENNLPKEISLAYLPNLGMVRLRLSLQANNEKEAYSFLSPFVKELYQLVGNNIYGENGISIENTIGNLLLAQKTTLATAESCTGGNIGHLLTSIPGSSTYFNGGVISYSNEVKINTLKVPQNVIETFGAVSQETVTYMAKNARLLLNSTYAIAVSGIAGPDGGTKDKPVGTVWIAVSSEKEVFTKKLSLTPFRDKNIRLSSIYALELLRKNFLI